MDSARYRGRWSWGLAFGLCALAACGGGGSGGDASVPDGAMDAPVAESGVDVQTDAGMDAGNDAGSDAAVDTGPDGADDAGDAGRCFSDLECDDHVFCNGLERCAPDAPGAGERGCVFAAEPPCPADAGMVCDEAMQQCVPDPCPNPDADGDGVRSVLCGGDDCDDQNPNVFPGNPEVCDGLDNQCDGMTDEEPAASASCPARTACSMGQCLPYFLVAGEDFTVAAQVATGMAGWGSNIDRQIASGSTLVYARPTPVTDPTDIVTLAVGESHLCVIHSDGHVGCRGDNTYKQVTAADFRPSDPIVDVAGATAVSAGEDFSCAIVAGGMVKCWGDYLSGQLGGGGYSTSTLTIAPVQNLAGAVSIASHGEHSCAVLDSGGVQCWGANNYGESGDRSMNSQTSSVAIAGITDAVGLALGVFHSCALHATGAVSCWGRNAHGELGNGMPAVTMSETPVSVLGIADAVEISAGDYYTCARRATGAVSCWGQNNEGQLGTRDKIDRPSPEAVMGVNGVIALATGGSHVCVRLQGFDVLCWGQGGNGQLGNGMLSSSLEPVAVSGLP